jgi:predicted transcriptional regulator
MLEAIEGCIERDERRAKFRAEIEEARTEYLETGLHVTHAEVKAWMASWGTDNELEPPQCHR